MINKHSFLHIKAIIIEGEESMIIITELTTSFRPLRGLIQVEAVVHNYKSTRASGYSSRDILLHLLSLLHIEITIIKGRGV